ncbi:hypothetical protein HK100_006911, partial [Physocladia obscura]
MGENSQHELPANEMYLQTLVVLSAICTGAVLLQNWSSILAAMKGRNDPIETTPLKLLVFRRNYLSVYLLNMLGDWLQGPYLYPLYRSYGLSVADIAQLFVLGFMSSAVIGTFIGSLADSFSKYHVLAFGRIFGGVATSLLFSVFEAWMIREHYARYAFSDTDLSDTFAMCSFWNGLVAILSGGVANVAVDVFGLLAPFILAVYVFFGAFMIIILTWPENYGDKLENNGKIESVFTSLAEGLVYIKKDYWMFAIGMTQSLFESAMYTFIFMWSVAIEAAAGDSANIPFGIIFASFMV